MKSVENSRNSNTKRGHSGLRRGEVGPYFCSNTVVASLGDCLDIIMQAMAIEMLLYLLGM